MDYENDYISDSKSESTENEMEKIRKLDKRYYSYTKTVFNDKKSRFKMLRIGMYATGNTGSQIRNAVTGLYYPDFVGTENEKLYFSVADCTGRFSKGSLWFYYDSQKQYETHNNPVYPVYNPKQKPIRI
jgi:hypothetical protein